MPHTTASVEPPTQFEQSAIVQRRSPRRQSLLVAALVLTCGLADARPALHTNQIGQAAQPEAGEELTQTLRDIPGVAALRSLAERQSSEPDAGVTPQELASLIGADLVAELRDPAERARAEAACDGVLAALRAALADEFPPRANVTPDARWQAVRAYVEGRTALNRGEVDAGLAALKRATELDPGSHEAWLLMGEVQLSGARRASGLASLRSAVAAGAGVPEPLWLLGREALRTARLEEATRLLAGAQARLEATGDDAVKLLVQADLGEALLRTGRLTCGIEFLSRGLDLPQQPGFSTRRRDEMGELLRRRSDLHLAIGDAWLKLGNADNALRAYDDAAIHATLDLDGVRQRRMHALLKLGRSAQVALDTLATIERSEGLVSQAQLTLIRSLGERLPLSEPLTSLIDRLTKNAPPTTRVDLRLALAAAAPDRALQILQETARTDPSSRRAVLAVAQSVAPQGPDAVAAQFVLLAQNAPRHAAFLAPLSLASVRANDLLDSLAQNPAPASKLLESHVRLLVGDAAGGLAAVESVSLDAGGPQSLPPELAASLLSARVRALAELGRWKESEQTYERLRSIEAPEDGGQGQGNLWLACVRAESLGRLWRHGEAAAELEAQLTDEANENEAQLASRDRSRIDALLLGASVAARADRAGEAASLLRRALAADPRDERAYEGLILLHSRDGSLPDEQELVRVLRAIREALPSSRALRFQLAKELARAGNWSQAESTLRALAEDDSTDPQVVALLSLVWQQLGQLDGSDGSVHRAARTWFEAARRKQPGLPWLLVGEARFRALAGDAVGAERLLEAELARTRSPEIARARERIVREQLNDSTRASALALTRLSAAPPTPEHALELAEIAIEANAWPEHEARVRLGLAGAPPAASSAQLPRLRALAERATRIAIESVASDPNVARGTRQAAIGVIDLVQALGGEISKQLQEAGIFFVLVENDPQAIARRTAAFTLAHAGDVLGSVDRIAQSLREASMASRIPKLCNALLPAARPLTPRVISEWMSQLAEHGDSADCLAFIELIPGAALGPLFNAGAAPADEKHQRAELAYVFSNELMQIGREEQSLALGLRTLELKPDHAWAANNVGYTLLERGQVDEAAPLIERAFAQLSDSPNVVDSLGWLRYHQGRLGDEVAEDGNVVPGAVTLLELAAKLSAEEPSEEQLDHLGDAKWASGAREEAQDHWRRALTIAQETLAFVARNATPLERHYHAKLKSLITRIQSKLDAAKAGQEPPIARKLGAAPKAASPDQ
ncbi:MAG: hypothetical protein SFZ23_01790 [Planctomycetota bacterium]|nr:hypothetical protein [Planctomycetota bacterium]